MAGKRDAWMPMYWGDYLRDTLHLRPEGHGIYILLIAAYWTNGGPLPDDDDYLSAVARVDQTTWQKLKPTISKFFTVVDGEWRQKRIDLEIFKAKNITEVRQTAGKKGGKITAKRKAKAKQNHQQTATPSQSQSPSQPQEQPEEGAGSPASPDDAPEDDLTEIPPILDRTEDGEAVRLWNDLAERLGLAQVQRITAGRRSKLRGRLRDCGGMDGWKDALAKIESIPGLRGGHGGNGHENWRANFDWLLQESSFTKLMEGAYDHWGKGNGDGFSAVADRLERGGVKL